MNQRERRGASQTGEGVGKAGQFGARGLRPEGFLDEAILDGPGAAHAPIGGGHLLDETELDVIDGAEALEVEAEELFERCRTFVRQEDRLRQQAVALGVLERAELTGEWDPAGYAWRKTARCGFGT